MLTLIHGNDLVSSRDYFVKERQNAKNPLVLEIGKLNITDFTQAIQGNTLFTEEKDVFIEELYEKKKSKKEFGEITSSLNSLPSIFNIYIWEDKILSNEDLSYFPKAAIKTFKIPQSIFLFLDSIRPNNYKELIMLFQEVLKTTKEEVVFAMIVRQFRILLALSEETKDSIDEIKRLAPWQRSKFQRQTKLFKPEKLKDCYKKLYEIDYAQKTGTLTYSIRQAIDFFLLRI